jgi:hypothetical protein
VLQELISLFPKDVGPAGLAIAIVGTIVGFFLWLLGSRFSRKIVTLLTVLLGAMIGRHLPQWFGWEISGAGPAVGGALVLGVTGYVLHGMWVGIGFGLVLALWAALACWITLHNTAIWAWPAVDTQIAMVDYSRALWTGMPTDVTRIMPYACGTAMVTGLGLAIIWPRVSLLLGWSMIGVTFLVTFGLAAMSFGRPELLEKVPSPLWAQASLVALLVSLGALVQWKLGPKPVAAKPSKKKESDSDEPKSS